MTSFRILGPVQAWEDERPLELGGPRQLALFACLVLHANQAVSSDALVDAVWGQARQASAKRLQMAIARLRRALEPLAGENGPRLRTVVGGYLLAVGSGELDAEVFEAGLQAGRAALESGEPASGAELLRRALALWRGPPLAEVAFQDFAQAEIRRLDELRLVALEARIEADLQLGRHAQLIGELEALLAQQPNREQIARQLMLALYRCGRQADALEAYQRTRRQLAEELGLDPGPALRALQHDILKHAPSLWAPSTGSSAAHRPSGSEDSLPVEDLALPRAEVLIGRDREVAELSALLTDQEVALVTLAGIGGAGKTSLALHVAREVGPSFQGGVTVVWLANIDEAGQVLPELARRLGVELSGREPAVETLARVLRFQRRLIILDNFEHVLDAAPAVAELIAKCDQLKVLATSRAPLRASFERVCGVSGLDVPAPHAADSVEALEQWPATALFIERARAADRNFEPTADAVGAIGELCRYLAGLPLALELAAARTRVLGSGSPSSPGMRGSGSRRSGPNSPRSALAPWAFSPMPGFVQGIGARRRSGRSRRSCSSRFARADTDG